MEKKKTSGLKSVGEQVEGCEKCDLCHSGLGVPGEGSADTNVMFVGEAPGRVESETGRPFAGPAGKLLTKLLELAGLKREDVFITSVVKHRPPQNRKPNRVEVKACFPYLTEQLKIISPRVVVLLGSTALESVLGKETGKITALHGKSIEREGKTYFITYHPAAGLRSADIVLPLLNEDFKKLGELLKTPK